MFLSSYAKGFVGENGLQLNATGTIIVELLLEFDLSPSLIAERLTKIMSSQPPITAENLFPFLRQLVASDYVEAAQALA
jgi:hypothetical protein